MIKAQLEDRNRIVDYLSKDIDNCVYLYIDVKTYDICSENVAVWYQEENGEIVSVVMKYYDSFQIYSRIHDIDAEEIMKLINTYKVSMISGPRFLIEKIEKMCAGYEAIYGEVFENFLGDVPINANIVEHAKVEDAKEIAELICTVEEFSRNYSVESLTKQIHDRISMGLGRSIIVRDNGKIVAHISTYAEAEDVAVISGAVVLPQFRDTDYYVAVSSYLNWELGNEKKRFFAFAINKRVIYLLRNTCRKCGCYGKLVKSRCE